jgi:hypothetical protein
MKLDKRKVIEKRKKNILITLGAVMLSFSAIICFANAGYIEIKGANAATANYKEVWSAQRVFGDVGSYDLNGTNLSFEAIRGTCSNGAVIGLPGTSFDYFAINGSKALNIINNCEFADGVIQGANDPIVTEWSVTGTNP